MDVAVVEAEGLRLLALIVVDEGLDIVEGAVCKKDVGKVGFMDVGAFSVDYLGDRSLGTIGCALIINNVFAGLFLSAVRTPQDIPVRGAECPSCLLLLFWQRHTSRGHPCM